MKYKLSKKEDVQIWCDSETCKTKCFRNVKYKDNDNEVFSLDWKCDNYWNGKNFDKPKNPFFILEDIDMEKIWKRNEKKK